MLDSILNDTRIIIFCGINGKKSEDHHSLTHDIAIPKIQNIKKCTNAVLRKLRDFHDLNILKCDKSLGALFFRSLFLYDVHLSSLTSLSSHTSSYLSRRPPTNKREIGKRDFFKLTLTNEYVYSSGLFVSFYYAQLKKILYILVWFEETGIALAQPTTCHVQIRSTLLPGWCCQQEYSECFWDFSEFERGFSRKTTAMHVHMNGVDNVQWLQSKTVKISFTKIIDLPYNRFQNLQTTLGKEYNSIFFS